MNSDLSQLLASEFTNFKIKYNIYGFDLNDKIWVKSYKFEFTDWFVS